ncbi:MULTISPECIES: hypothetical protein [Streptomyces]|uniref:Uncharacterized protein n=1 Tax=Streptomyces doudnae TaxID=3075536 RepID=A0ABD5F1Y4_9ACTN|nr:MULTISPECIES: hypothetical protein [unclassified Streptomyces]MDT0440249.1 hypothetical protein [Streptomyces sp. DSM 41981]MYQ63176.1 hypothetical protein [Streptomyces sp. SID4950]SCD52628.1 hypothetical protein GA0115242_10754 [Streptomyces sp. SolWspMP-5a-2]
MRPARPTLRSLREDLKLSLPSAREPLDELDHPILAKAREHFADDAAGHERIRSIDDEVLLKVKIQRWRGAVWTDGDLPWLIAAGQREDGSPDDFYSALETAARAARAHYNANNRHPLSTTTYVGHLLPDQNDRDRYQLEAGARLVRTLAAAVQELARGSLHDGHEHAADFPAFRLGVLVRADDGHETYAAVRITGSVPDDLIAVILRHVPGCDPAAWYPEYALPSRPLLPAEQAWSTLMDPKAAAELLDDE